jgi:cellulose synthase operon protein C
MTSDLTPPETPQAGENPAEVVEPAREETGEPPVLKPSRGPVGRVVVSLVVLGTLVILAFSPASHLAARGLLLSPSNPAKVVTGPQHGPVTAVQSVPVGLPSDARIRTAADVFPYAVAALGEPAATALMKLLNSASYLSGTAVGANTGPISYPYRYPPLDAVLDRAPPASLAANGTALGAALAVLAAQPQSGIQLNADAISNAAAAAYGVLDRVRDNGRCAAQLDLLLLITADQFTMQADEYQAANESPSPPAKALSQEEERAETDCPHDPTPGWLVGQAELRWVNFSESPTFADASDVTALRTATATFGHLADEYPRDPGVLTGLGDSYLRAGTYLRSSEPFTARQDFRSAIAQYNRASALGDERDAAPGVARALIGLGQPAQAVRLLTPLAGSSSYPGQLLELLIEADEAAHDFAPAVIAARRLGQRAGASYPDGSALVPVPLSGSVDPLDDVSLPLSFGVGRITPLTDELIPPGGAGGSVQDLTFIPEYRDDRGVTGSEPACPAFTEIRDEMLLGRSAQVVSHWPATLVSVRPGGGTCYASDELKLMAEVQVGQKLDPTTMKKDSLTSDDIADDWQNLLRWAGKLSAAKQFTEEWQTARGDRSGLPALRLGEIDFLTHLFNDSAAEFGLAARRFRLVQYNDDVQTYQAELDRGTALFDADRPAEATATLRPLDLIGAQGYSYQNSAGGTDALDFAGISYYACEQLADYESQSGNLRAAAEDYTNALDWVPTFQETGEIRPEVLNNNAALAYLGLRDTKAAAALERKALASDPDDPVFLMTAGFIADRSGQLRQAARYDREALISDPGAFPAANDLGVELTREHHDGEAAQALRQAVGANPRYALGWFNLGVVESKLGPAHLLDAQGAFAVAYSVNPALQSRQHTMTIDASVYRTALDLSKPLPPSWSISQLPQPVPAAAVGLLAVVLLGLGLARATGHGGGTLAAQWLDPLAGRLQSAPILRRLLHPAWGIAATAASFLFAYLRKEASPAEVVTYLAGVVILALLTMGVRQILARRYLLTVRHESWPPGLAFGLVTGAAGLPWAPLPVIKTDDEAEGKDVTRVHLAAPVLLAALSALLFVEAVWLHTPVTQSWAVAALIMSASTLLPVGPLDGAQLGPAGVLAAAGIVAGALLVGLGLI